MELHANLEMVQQKFPKLGSNTIEELIEWVIRKKFKLINLGLIVKN